MTSLADSVELLITSDAFAAGATITKSIQALHLDEEVEYIWSRPWSWGKIIYLATRYSGAVFFILMLVTLVPVRWNDFGHMLDPDTNSHLVLLEKGPCLGGHLYLVSGIVILSLAEVILAMRVHALYGLRKRIIVLSVILITISAATFQLFGLAWTLGSSSECIGKACVGTPVIPFRITVTCTEVSTDITFFGWIGASLVELVFLILVLVKTRKMKKVGGEYSLVSDEAQPYAHDIIGLMARDSKSYFIRIFAFCAVGTCCNLLTLFSGDKFKSKAAVIAFFLLLVQQNTILTVVIIVVTVLAPKLLLNIRMEYYGPVGSLADKTQLSWNPTVPLSESANADSLDAAVGAVDGSEEREPSLGES
ncbi:hypothetical protein M0805_000421 [Coniferiporia weirii]|nr:hypothetical protein M0805_000421 [Coniferiporia weirii]